MATKRSFKRTCDICGRGHSCFETERPVEIVVKQDAEKPSLLGSSHNLTKRVVGEWHHVEQAFDVGTRLRVVNAIEGRVPGEIRVWVEAPDGRKAWMSAETLLANA